VSVLIHIDKAFFYLPCGYALEHQFFLLYPVSYTHIDERPLSTAVQFSTYSVSWIVLCVSLTTKEPTCMSLLRFRTVHRPMCILRLHAGMWREQELLKQDGTWNMFPTFSVVTEDFKILLNFLNNKMCVSDTEKVWCIKTWLKKKSWHH
jgi:hypothetical protein